jgi:hypothetical protein
MQLEGKKWPDGDAMSGKAVRGLGKSVVVQHVMGRHPGRHGRTELFSGPNTNGKASGVAPSAQPRDCHGPRAHAAKGWAGTPVPSLKKDSIFFHFSPQNKKSRSRPFLWRGVLDFLLFQHASQTPGLLYRASSSRLVSGLSDPTRAPVPTPPPRLSAARARATPASASAGTRASLHLLALSISSVRTLSLPQSPKPLRSGS